MAQHIKKGKHDLNFSEFGNYSSLKQQSKLRAIANSMEEGSMPVASYLWMHRDAQLTKDQKVLIAGWASAMKDSLSIKE